jgi:hypothetical protein
MTLPRQSITNAKTPSSDSKTPIHRLNAGSSKWLIGSMAVLLLATGYLSYQLYQLKSNPNIQGQKELDSVIKKVGKLVILPENETPTLATVTDPEKLKNQPFFAKAQVGYKVLLYSQAQKAILYDPVSNRVVEIAPINPASTPTTAPPTDTDDQTTGP